jgi:hypothetical protein
MSDEELIAMLKVRREQEIIQSDKPVNSAGEKPKDGSGVVDAAPSTKAEPKWNDPEWTLDFFKDAQLSAAVQAMQAKLDTGSWKQTGGEAATITAVVGSELGKLHAARDRLTRELIRIEKRAESLEKGATIEQATAGRDLWPDTLDVTGGKMQVFDKDGKLVATLDITSNTLERWLVDADVKKSKEEAAK